MDAEDGVPDTVEDYFQPNQEAYFPTTQADTVFTPTQVQHTPLYQELLVVVLWCHRPAETPSLRVLSDGAVAVVVIKSEACEHRGVAILLVQAVPHGQVGSDLRQHFVLAILVCRLALPQYVRPVVGLQIGNQMLAPLKRTRLCRVRSPLLIIRILVVLLWGCYKRFVVEVGPSPVPGDWVPCTSSSVSTTSVDFPTGRPPYCR